MDYVVERPERQIYLVETETLTQPESPWRKQAWQQEADSAIYLYRHRKNKLRVALAPKSSNDIVALSVVYCVGSKAEGLGCTGSVSLQ